MTDLAARLSGVLHAWLDVAMPYQGFATQLFRTAADPRSPLSPFSADSSPARERAVATMREAVEGSSIGLDPALRPSLPHLLWLLQMGLVLFWVYDDSPGARRSRELVDGLVPLVVRVLRLSRLRVLRGTTADLLALLGRLGLPSAEPDGGGARPSR